jgi:hypothetical protein
MKKAVVWNTMLCGLERTDVLEECITSIIEGKRISELGTMVVIALLTLFQAC